VRAFNPRLAAAAFICSVSSCSASPPSSVAHQPPAAGTHDRAPAGDDRRRRGLAFLETGDYESAERVFSGLLATNPNDAVVAALHEAALAGVREQQIAAGVGAEGKPTVVLARSPDPAGKRAPIRGRVDVKLALVESTLHGLPRLITPDRDLGIARRVPPVFRGLPLVAVAQPFAIAPSR
jgi:hypothetical protein